MDKRIIIVCLSMLILLTPVRSEAVHQPVTEVCVWTPKGEAYARGEKVMAIPEWVVKLIKAAVDQVLKAMNLALQRIQNKNIDLSNAAKIAESIIHSKGMEGLVQTGKKMKALYEKYYNDLKKVKDTIVTLATVKELLETEKKLVEDYAQILDMVSSNDVFTVREIEFITSASATVLDNARKSIENVKLIVESFKTDMTDSERLTLIKNMNQRIDNEKAIMSGLKSKVANIILIRKSPDVNSIELFFAN